MCINLNKLKYDNQTSFFKFLLTLCPYHAGQSWSFHVAMFISSDCPYPSTALQVQNRGLKHHSFIPGLAIIIQGASRCTDDLFRVWTARTERSAKKHSGMHICRILPYLFHISYMKCHNFFSHANFWWSYDLSQNIVWGLHFYYRIIIKFIIIINILALSLLYNTLIRIIIIPILIDIINVVLIIIIIIAVFICSFPLKAHNLICVQTCTGSRWRHSDNKDGRLYLLPRVGYSCKRANRCHWWSA